MGAESLAVKLDEPVARGRELLRLHKETYPTYWKWSDAIRDYAVLNGKMHAVFGWSVHVEGNVNPRSLRNFPLQANGGEMLRLACCLTVEQGIKVCAPIHDALLIEVPSDVAESEIERCRSLMEEASRVVLGGFTIKTDAEIIRYPSRYMDKRGAEMWRSVCELISSET